MATMPSRRAEAVDTRIQANLSFAPASPQRRALDPSHADFVGNASRPALVVRPGRTARSTTLGGNGGPLGSMPDLPLQVEKVQAPPLRPETLSRVRLLDWLTVKIHSRVVLLVAEAGYGKTTLLADFARRTRTRILWYRLDRGDRDWTGFVSYLVASVRSQVPEFGTVTVSLLREPGAAPPARQEVVDALTRELGDLPERPTALVFDDFHLVDDVVEICDVVNELVARAPDRLSFVLASRRTPPVRLARLRALGEVAELNTDDLRFDTLETAALFREAYDIQLEPSLVSELSRRTEGWAASLQLVRAALHDRDATQVRSFISSLNGAEGHIYDYLAEEVVGDLSVELQDFLMRTSVLETIDLDLGPVAADIGVAACKRLIDEGESRGLLGRRSTRTRYQVRAHPLVRDFLKTRLLRSIGVSDVATIHRRVAVAAEAVDWRTASTHYMSAGAFDDIRRVLAGSLQTILATGAYGAAEEVVARIPPSGEREPWDLVLASRIAQQSADSKEGLRLAESAWKADPSSLEVILNLVTARTLAGDLTGALEAGDLLQKSSEAGLAQIGRAYHAMIDTSLAGSLETAATELRSLISHWRAGGDHHFLGVALNNLAYVLKAMADVDGAREAANEAIELLERSSAGIELVSAMLARAWTLAYVGDIEGARLGIQEALARAPSGQSIEVGYEAGEIEAFFGESEAAWPMLADTSKSEGDTGDQALLVRAILQTREGRFEAAALSLGLVDSGKYRTAVAFEARRQLAQALNLTLQGDPNAAVVARRAAVQAHGQGALLWGHYGDILAASADRSSNPSAAVEHFAAVAPPTLSMAAEPLLGRLAEFSAQALSAISDEARRQPARWRPAIRHALELSRQGDRHLAGEILAEIGESSDIAILRERATVDRDRRIAANAKKLARRLAAPIYVDDLGRVRLTIGTSEVDGSAVRRKVLSLLCFLITRPNFAASREEALDGLWPDFEPDAAMNSLNQTVYFLRRVFEPDYHEATSPGYVHQDGETIWLDTDLIQARSNECRALIRSMPGAPSPEKALALARAYRGRFALDFAYDEWAVAYRDSLHAAYLRVMEQAIRLDVDDGHFARGITLAEQVSEVEPESEEIHVALVRLYQLSGAHAAAAEQYQLYVRSLQDLGIEPSDIAQV
jgi:LuxR family maltose regulon positive regulatory protein